MTLTPFMKIKEVADWLALTERTVYRLVHEGKLPAYRVGGQWRFDAREIEA
jgi:excisionase family DNA binding protein